MDALLSVATESEVHYYPGLCGERLYYVYIILYEQPTMLQIRGEISNYY